MTVRQSSLLIALLSSLFSVASSYPVIFEVAEYSTRCFRFNLPSHDDDDDAHLVVLPLPSKDLLSDDTVEAWYTEQVYQLTLQKEVHQHMPKRLPDQPPDHVAQQMSDFLKAHHVSRLRVKVTNTPSSDPSNVQVQYATKYFSPLVINYIAKVTQKRASRHNNGDGNMEGYGICLENSDEENAIQVVFDLIFISEEIPDEDEEEEDHKPSSGFQKERHLTPLEQSLDLSIAAANTVLREMKYMEKREQRMRMTADNINNRVRYFSYLSIAVLLAVTVVQVSYLKRYFHKKKLM